MNIRALVVDDEPLARARMRRLLEPHGDVAVVGEAAHGEAAVQQVLALRPDLVFLDIHMPGLDGTAVASRLRDYLPEGVRPWVVFTTAHPEHAVDAFGLECLDYLLKPVERDRLAECLRRVRRAVWAQGRFAPGAAPGAASAPGPVTLTGHRGAALEAVPVQGIVSLHSDEGVAFACTSDGQRHRLGEGLAEVEARLPSPPFVRVSRSAIVHLERVDRLVRHADGTWSAVMDDAREIPVSRRQVKGLRELLGV
jgi:DNA-binding LytR/AlgR family response regulator